jgi:hypothetical protein
MKILTVILLAFGLAACASRHTPEKVQVSKRSKDEQSAASVLF